MVNMLEFIIEGIFDYVIMLIIHYLNISLKFPYLNCLKYYHIKLHNFGNFQPFNQQGITLALITLDDYSFL